MEPYRTNFSGRVYVDPSCGPTVLKNAALTCKRLLSLYREHKLLHDINKEQFLNLNSYLKLKFEDNGLDIDFFNAGGPYGGGCPALKVIQSRDGLCFRVEDEWVVFYITSDTNSPYLAKFLEIARKDVFGAIFIIANEYVETSDFSGNTSTSVTSIEMNVHDHRKVCTFINDVCSVLLYPLLMSGDISDFKAFSNAKCSYYSFELKSPGEVEVRCRDLLDVHGAGINSVMVFLAYPKKMIFQYYEDRLNLIDSILGTPVACNRFYFWEMIISPMNKNLRISFLIS